MRVDPSNRRLPIYVLAVVSAGGLAMATAIPGAGQIVAPPAGRLVACIAVLLAADLPFLSIRFGHNRSSFTWSEASVLVGLVLLPSPWLRIIAPLCSAACHAVLRRSPTKILFNAAAMGVGVTLAGIVWDAMGRGVPGHLGVRDGVTLVAATFVYFLWNDGSVSVAIALSQRIPVRSVLIQGAPLGLLVWLGNTVVGLCVVEVAAWRSDLLPALPVVLAVFAFSYRASQRAISDRDMWQQLEAASREVIQPLPAEVAAAALDRAVALFRAESAQLAVVDGVPGTVADVYDWDDAVVTHRSGDPFQVVGSLWPRVIAERESFRVDAATASTGVRREMASSNVTTGVVGPLVGDGGCLGFLSIGFKGRIRMAPREMKIFATFVNHVSAAMANALRLEEMSEERAKLSLVVEHSSDGICSVDMSGRVTSWNPAMEVITGRSADEMMGIPLFVGVSAADSAGKVVPIDWLSTRLAGGDGAEAELTLTSADGRRRWLHLSMTAVHAEQSIVVVARDVTGWKEAEEAKQDFIATVSHELRTPLTTIIGFLLTFQRTDWTPEPEDLRQIHLRMLDKARRLERLIEDLLSTSRIERGEFTIELGAVGIDECIDKVLADFRINSGRQVEHHRAGMAGTAIADAGRLEQILVNLLSNADKYSGPQRPVIVAAERVDDEVVVSVSDEGPGIPDSEREHVFERFFRLGHHMTREAAGTGLGLYIARQLVEAMHGRIWVESRPGGGARFRFAIPAAALVAETPGPSDRRVS